ncbi:MAG: AAA family ATPase [Deltaproteobacteria bacterium]|nr:AAA family ATPase [Deltaproteobacteria bacterium]
MNKSLGDGLWPGMYCLIGGTGAGKTQWAVQMAVHAASAGSRVLYLALELSRRELAARIVGNVAGVPWSDLLYGRLGEAGVEKAIAQSEQQVRVLPLHVSVRPRTATGRTRLTNARELRPALVVLDYLQLCGGRAGEEPRLSVGRVSYVARALARDLNAVVLVLSSTARANYEALVSNPARDATDFVGLGKESGEIEYAADGVLVLARHAKKPDVRVLVVAKHRHAALKGGADMRWTGAEFLASAVTKVRC